MKLENLKDLIDASLLNNPSVFSFEDISLNALKIKRGDIFLAFDEDDIELAIQNGAYCIVFEGLYHISDKEVAWLKVDSLEIALKKLIRYTLIEKNITAYECNEIILKLSMHLSISDKIFILKDNIKNSFESLINLQKDTLILFAPQICDSTIFALKSKLPSSKHNLIEIIEQTIFETSFIYDNHYYERELISPFFIPYLEDILNFLEISNVEFKIKKFMPIDHFEAIFINRKFEIKNFGTSEMVLIFEPKISLVKNQIAFIKKYAPWANTIYILPKSMLDKVEQNVYIYNHKSEILDILQEIKFNFALIVGCDKSILANQDETKNRQLTFSF